MFVKENPNRKKKKKKKLEQLSGKKVLKFAFLGNCFCDLFTDV